MDWQGAMDWKESSNKQGSVVSQSDLQQETPMFGPLGSPKNQWLAPWGHPQHSAWLSVLLKVHDLSKSHTVPDIAM